MGMRRAMYTGDDSRDHRSRVSDEVPVVSGTPVGAGGSGTRLRDAVGQDSRLRLPDC